VRLINNDPPSGPTLTVPALTRPRPGGRALRHRAGRRPGVSGTRDALLAAATQLFAERGYEGVPVRAIARKAGVNNAMISYHFGGKRQLYREIVRATFSEIVARVERLGQSPRPAADLLREFIAMLGEEATRQHPYFPTMFLREVLTGGKHLEPGMIDMPVRVMATVQRIIERGVRDGAFRPVDPVLTHLSMVGSLIFFFATESFRTRVLAARHPRMKAPDGAAYVEHIQDLITHGLAASRTNGRARDVRPRSVVPVKV
jgi:AcrR family transcriptional regulator